MARLVVPNHPHHVTQRGNRRQPVFFVDDDYRAYLALMQKACACADTVVLAYCLMPNHVHLIMMPRHEDGLRGAIAEAHRRYTRRVNFRQHWRGHVLHTRPGRPLGSEGFIERLESITGRTLRPARPGPKPKVE